MRQFILQICLRLLNNKISNKNSQNMGKSIEYSSLKKNIPNNQEDSHLLVLRRYNSEILQSSKWTVKSLMGASLK